MTDLPEYLYLHVPFCKSICHYCDFTHIGYNEKNALRWIEALEKEIHIKQISNHLKTIYLGGGTPTALSYEILDRLLSLLDYYAQNVLEYTIEINPETLTYEKALCLAKHGVNRASIGFQSSNMQLLKLMNRNHCLKTVEHSITMLKKVGIENISLDLMYSLPNQTLQEFQKSTLDAISFNPKHLSLYSLTIEPHTVFAQRGYQSADEELEADMYEWIIETLPKYGFIQYEISNFAQQGYSSLHNQAYWNFFDYYGISLGATGKEKGIIYENTQKFNLYLENPILCYKTELSLQEEMFESLMMGLRLIKGLDKKQFQIRYKTDIHNIWHAQIEKNKEKGLLLETNQYLFCSTYGLHILNSILLDFM